MIEDERAEEYYARILKTERNLIEAAKETVCPLMSGPSGFVNCVANECQLWDYGQKQCQLKRRKI